MNTQRSERAKRKSWFFLHLSRENVRSSNNIQEDWFFFNFLLLFFAEKRARLNRNIIHGKIVSEHEKFNTLTLQKEHNFTLNVFWSLLLIVRKFSSHSGFWG